MTGCGPFTSTSVIVTELLRSKSRMRSGVLKVTDEMRVSCSDRTESTPPLAFGTKRNSDPTSALDVCELERLRLGVQVSHLPMASGPVVVRLSVGKPRLTSGRVVYCCRLPPS